MGAQFPANPNRESMLNRRSRASDTTDMPRSIGSEATCPHGYRREVASADCPRCVERPPTEPPASRFDMTRWEATDTTLGPAAKLAITALIVLPMLTMAANLRHAAAQPEFAFVVVPLAALVIFAVRFLPDLWEPGGRRPRDGGRADD